LMGTFISLFLFWKENLGGRILFRLEGGGPPFFLPPRRGKLGEVHHVEIFLKGDQNRSPSPFFLPSPRARGKVGEKKGRLGDFFTFSEKPSSPSLFFFFFLFISQKTLKPLQHNSGECPRRSFPLAPPRWSGYFSLSPAFSPFFFFFSISG